jgi:hypothetical protein
MAEAIKTNNKYSLFVLRTAHRPDLLFPNRTQVTFIIGSFFELTARIMSGLGSTSHQLPTAFH